MYLRNTLKVVWKTTLSVSVIGQNVSTGASAGYRYFDFYVRKGQDDRL